MKQRKEKKWIIFTVTAKDLDIRNPSNQQLPYVVVALRDYVKRAEDEIDLHT